MHRVLMIAGIAVCLLSGCIADEPSLRTFVHASAAQGESSYASPYCIDEAPTYLEDWTCLPHAEIRYMYFQYVDAKLADGMRAALQSDGIFVFSLFVQGWPRGDVSSVSFRAADIQPYIGTDGAKVFGFIPTGQFCGLSDDETVTPDMFAVAFRRDPLASAERLFAVNVASVSVVGTEEGEGTALYLDAPDAVTWHGARRECEQFAFSAASCASSRSDPSDWMCDPGQVVEALHFEASSPTLRRIVEGLAEAGSSDPWRVFLYVSDLQGFLYCATAEVPPDRMQLRLSDPGVVAGDVAASLFVWRSCSNGANDEPFPPRGSLVTLYDLSIQVNDPEKGSPEYFEFDPDPLEYWVTWP